MTAGRERAAAWRAHRIGDRTAPGDAAFVADAALEGRRDDGARRGAAPVVRRGLAQVALTELGGRFIELGGRFTEPVVRSTGLAVRFTALVASSTALVTRSAALAIRRGARARSDSPTSALATSRPPRFCRKPPLFSRPPPLWLADGRGPSRRRRPTDRRSRRFFPRRRHFH
jgi:hypothetical protein